MKVVGLAGLARSGKSTAAAHLVSHLGYTRVRFADPLKAMVRALGLTEDEVDGNRKELPSPNLTVENFDELLDRMPRAFTAIGISEDWSSTSEVLLGRPVMVSFYAFSGVVAQAIARGGKDGGTPRMLMQLVGTEWGRDCIGQNFWISLWQRKADRILAAGGKVAVDDVRFENEVESIRKVGGQIIKIDRAGLTATSAHASEQFKFNADQTVLNDGTIDHLYEKIDKAMLEVA